MPNFNDIRDFIDSKKAEKASQRETHLRTVAAVGRNAQIVVDHPAWQVFVDHLTVLLEQAKSEHQQIISEMSNGNDFGDKLSALKLQLKEVNGKIIGYNHALDLIPELIERAARAAAELHTA